MEPEYLSYVKEDEELHRIVEPTLSSLRTLSPQQIETFIFYLKSLHSYYPASENHVAYCEQFSEKLETLRSSDVQKSLQRKASGLLLKAMIVGGLGGILLFSGLATLLGGANGWGGVLVVIGLGLFMLAEARFGTPALATAKEQDRRYFLESLRVARACNELDWAGLFSYNGATKPGPQSDSDIEVTEQRIAELTSQLRSALYNDEYMQYSELRK